MKLSEVLGALDERAAGRMLKWCQAQMAVRSTDPRFAGAVSGPGARFSTCDPGDPGELDDGDLGEVPVVAAVKLLIAAVWEVAFDEWAEAQPAGLAVDARCAATVTQRHVIDAVWVEAALVSGASPDGARVVAVLGPQWDGSPGSPGLRWAELLAAAVAASR